MKRYNPRELEPKWQAYWRDNKTFEVTKDDTKTKKYIIDMFPYPSGAAMHVGHVRNFTISDVLSQYHRQKGYNVMHTMGWDTFGLPAENYAIKTGTPPAESTRQNIDNFRAQLQNLGMSYDWSREINTSSPEYYKWTQWIFTQLFEKGLAYQKESPQWWCPTDKTVLANEQVENGKCWRCGSNVVKKSLNQWFFKITDYADELLDGIDDLDWPEKIKTMQRNWIGRSEGADITFQVDGNDELQLHVFTTRPDTLYGATFLVVAPEYAELEALTSTEQSTDVMTYRDAAVKKSEIERQENKQKTGVFTGRYALHPLSGEKLPIWVADYVLGGYGTGAIMAVPAHDERDNEFAQAFSLPIRQVIAADDVSQDTIYTGEGTLIASQQYDGLASSEARETIVKDLQAKHVAGFKTTYKMRDWLISRQRYWGAPIPIIHCQEHGAVAVPKADLPVTLPEVPSFEPTGAGSVLENVSDWVNTVCPTCGGPAKRETDTMDGYACSSWYFLRYSDPHNDTRAWDPAVANYWLPVDYYCGGDHAVSHLLYTRFWFHFFADQGWLEKTRREPVRKLVYNGYILAEDGTKMSKSKGNTVNPDELISQGYGADSVRLFEMFIAPYEQNTNWNTNGVPGTYRFLQRFWTLVQEFLAADTTTEDLPRLDQLTHRTIKKVSHDLDTLSFNTAVAAMMEFVNDLHKLKAAHGYGAAKQWHRALTTLAQLLAPFAPHIGEEVWHQLGREGSVHTAQWPVHDDALLVDSTVTIVVQINGKVRAKVDVPRDSEEAMIVAKATQLDNVAKFIDDTEPRKIIYVTNKLLNIVV